MTSIPTNVMDFYKEQSDLDQDITHDASDTTSQEDDDNVELSHIINPKLEENLTEYDANPPRRRHNSDDESIGSNYSPSSEAEASEDDRAHPSLPPPQDDDALLQRSPLKRGPPFPSPSHPFKRTKGPFNPDYMDLLNQDIEDAALRFVPHDTTTPSLPSSQIGLSYWTDAEKEVLFEAISRLGRHNPLAIASRIKTKSEFEVAHYLSLLRSSTAKRKHDRQDLDPIAPAELPAAKELSQACCNALEEAADALSLRQETYEESVERRRWADNWLVTQSNYARIEKEQEEEGILPFKRLKSVQMLKVGNWLALSDRVYMNASFQENNWGSISDEQPAIRATALEDFYALAVSVTRRLVAATVYVSEARVRAKREAWGMVDQVWRQDVEAAALSLGIPTSSHRFWAGAARRLRLDVYDDELSGVNEEGELETMSYEDVERELGMGGEYVAEDDKEEEGGQEPGDESEEKDHEEQIEAEEDQLPTASDSGSVSEGEARPPEAKESKQERKQIQDELEEFVETCDFVIPKTIRKLMRTRIRAARSQEAYANEVDLRASWVEEHNLWRVLGRRWDGSVREGEMVVVKVERGTKEPKTGRGTVEEVVGYYCGDGEGEGGEWRLAGVGGQELVGVKEGVYGEKGEVDAGRVSKWELELMAQDGVRRGNAQEGRG